MNVITNNEKKFQFRRTVITVSSKQRFKSLAKNKINEILLRNIYDFKGFAILERFLAKFRVIISPTFADYVNEVEHKGRRRIAYSLLIFGLLYGH